MKILLMGLWKEDSGQDLVEYGLLLVLVSLAAIAGMTGLAGAINSALLQAGASLNTTS